VIEAVPLLLAVVVVNFVIIQLTAGDPVQALVGNYPAPAEYIERVRKEFGLDQPACGSCWILSNIARGNLDILSRIVARSST